LREEAAAAVAGKDAIRNTGTAAHLRFLASTILLPFQDLLMQISTPPTITVPQFWRRTVYSCLQSAATANLGEMRCEDR
jgi:hypothetical protein